MAGQPVAPGLATRRAVGMDCARSQSAPLHCEAPRLQSPTQSVFSAPTEVTNREIPTRGAGMHKIAIPSYAIERALARRGRLHPFEDLYPARNAPVVVDL